MSYATYFIHCYKNMNILNHWKHKPLDEMNEKTVSKDLSIHNFTFIVNFPLYSHWKCATFNFQRIRFIAFSWCMNTNKMS